MAIVFSCCFWQYGCDDLLPDNTSLWFAGKVLVMENKLKDHLGRHEKSRVVIKISKKGQGAPAREPVSVQWISVEFNNLCSKHY